MILSGNEVKGVVDVAKTVTSEQERLIDTEA